MTEWFRLYLFTLGSITLVITLVIAIVPTCWAVSSILNGPNRYVSFTDYLLTFDFPLLAFELFVVVVFTLVIIGS